MPLTIHIPQPDTPQRRIAASEQSGRPQGRVVAASWVDDLVQTGKMVGLCSLCVHHFNPRGAGYHLWSTMWLPVLRCDWCNTVDRNCKAYIPDADWKLLSPDADRRSRRRGRWGRS